MKILKKDIKHGVVKVQVESLDDLWYLSNLIDPGDIVRGKTERKIKIGDEGDRKARVVKKFVFLVIEVTKVEFQESILRVGGTVVEGPEDITTGSHHTFNVEENVSIEIEKKQWLKYQLEKLDDAKEKSGSVVLIVCHDREEAVFGLLTRRGVELLSKIKGDVVKKAVDEKAGSNFYKEIAKVASGYDKKHNPGNIIIASPGFWREYSVREMGDLKKKIIQASCSVIGERGLQEVVKRPELKQALQGDRIRKEEEMLDEVMTAVSGDQACYGLDDCEEKVNNGAVKLLLVSENFLRKQREEENYSRLESLMKNVENMNGELHLISSQEASKKLDGLSGIAGVLRWKS